MIARRTAPLALYAALSVVLFGIPVLGHFGSHIVAVDDLDPSMLMWMLAWWPHALLHGLNPFVTHAMFYPDGYNLTWATSMPLPGVVLAPITLGFGPAVSWNVLQLLYPALSAWTAFLLCRHLTGRTVPALVGGYVFGFSPYILANLQTSPNIGFSALLPVFVLLVVKHVESKITARRFVISMVLALVAQFLISSEVLATGTLMGAMALALAYALLRTLRARLLETARLLVLVYGTAAVLVSPFLYYFFFGQHEPPTGTSFSADLLSFVLPRGLVALDVHGGPSLAHAGLVGYVGAPLVVLIGLFCWRGRRNRGVLLAALCAALAALLSLGGRIYAGGHRTAIPGPWMAFEHLPVLRYAIPARLAVYVMLPAAVIVAMWLSGWGLVDEGVRSAAGNVDRTALVRWGLAVLALAFILPDVGSRAWNTAIADPPFFQHHAYRAYLNSRDRVFTIPEWGPSQRWVADAGFPFAISTGSGGQGLPAAYRRYPIWEMLLTYPYVLPSNYPTALRRFLAAKRVTAIVVERGFPGPWQRLFGTLGIRPVAIGGVLLYRLDGRSAHAT